MLIGGESLINMEMSNQNIHTFDYILNKNGIRMDTVSVNRDTLQREKTERF